MYRAILFLFLALLIPAKVLAFKINTHVWVGSEVLEDLYDDKVTIEPFGEFSVNQDILSAIKNNPQAYLYGNVGPDFFPDILAGQLTTHPGKTEHQEGKLSSGWNSDQWFAHLIRKRKYMDDEALAFTMGFLAHGASDFWSHSYVNTYSGSIYNIFDGDGQEGEYRHFLVEDFIGDHTPYVDIKAYHQGSIQNMYDFIAEELIYTPRVRDKYTLVAPHLALASYLREGLPLIIAAVKTFRSQNQAALGDLVQSVHDEREELHNAEKDIVRESCQAETISVNKEEVEKLDQQIINITHEIDQASTRVDNGLNATNSSLDAYAIKYENMGFEVAKSSLDKLHSLENQMLSTKQSIDNKFFDIERELRKKIRCPEDIFGNEDPGCKRANRLIDSLVSSLRNEVSSLERDLLNIKQNIDSELLKLKQSLIQAATEVHRIAGAFQIDVTISFNQMLVSGHSIVARAKANQNISRDLIIDFMNEIDKINANRCKNIDEIMQTGNVGAVESGPYVVAFLYAYFTEDWDGFAAEWIYDAVLDWQRGVNQAIPAYVETQRKIVDALLEGGKVKDATDILEEWLICEGVKMAGVTPFTSELLCAGKINIDNIQKGIHKWTEEIDQFATEFSTSIGIPEDMVITKTKIDTVMKDAAKDFAIQQLKEIEEFKVLVSLYDGTIDMDDQFSTTLQQNNYLTFNQITDPFSNRMIQEMHVQNGYFDKNKFAPAYNAIVLAKLSLLDASELNRLVSIAGGHSGKYGSTLFDDSAYKAYLQSPVNQIHKDEKNLDKLLQFIADAYEIYDEDSWVSDGLNFISEYYDPAAYNDNERIADPFNILFGSVRTLDGDHQWLEEPPRHIRKDGKDPMHLGNLSYSPRLEQGKGFRLYQDDLARKNVFNRIFIGPNVAAIQVPYRYGLKPVIPSSYPYRPCESNPFPDGEQDQSCIVSWLIPVLSILH
ncbi:zinc dependent phospholipase C family protein [Teredinibacter sp. KSP-S5-2]|uniref:zinc dependent phospholipase C family protein n=1 Tax=Teredinibacter sp. KSP-S5-2 TaxID=3034506 RepID=UPI0029349CA7|nr:zinc dependent phospholipase C family protein [Teredinibacter sp. KSP-S5-2]WNO08328.1 zinc dependent phospholipase C family protein [Teredinibacter sp. KSP-S5-2]